MTSVPESGAPTRGGLDEACALDRATDPGPPQVQLLSNGRYHVMVTAAGGGYSQWQGLALTRWLEDATRDNWGAFCYVKQIERADVWSTTRQPTQRSADSYQAVFSAGRATFQRRDGSIEIETVIAVSDVDDVELRRVRITNHAPLAQTIELTSYVEVVLATPAADRAHPAFEKLFIETQILDAQHGIVCSRRGRDTVEPTPSAFHLMNVHGCSSEQLAYETDRARFVGRGRNSAHPRALDGDTPLSSAAGSVLDPIAAIRGRVLVAPGESRTIDLISGVANDLDTCLALVNKYQDPGMAERVLDSAATYFEETLSKIGAAAADVSSFIELASSVIYANPSLRVPRSTQGDGEHGQAALWRYAISGDLPIVLLKVASSSNLSLAHRLVAAHAYWHAFGLEVDLVIVVDDDHQIEKVKALTGNRAGRDLVARSGCIFVLSRAALTVGDGTLFDTVARVVIDDRHGTLVDQLERTHTKRDRRSMDADRLQALAPEAFHPAARSASTPVSTAINGLGGFTPDGREYVVKVVPDRMTPMPWINILANPSFGTLVSESGSANTWSENAQAFRLTPWSNDPIGDPNTEAFYVRDEESGRFWSPTLLPSPGLDPYVVRHGFGYSVFEHAEHGIGSEMTMYVAVDAPIKVVMLKLRNQSDRARALSVTGYVEWVLGENRATTSVHVATWSDAVTGALLAHNPYNTDFAGRTAFFDVDDVAASSISTCTDRLDFIGREGSLRSPMAMRVGRLSGDEGSAFDPCAAIRVPLTIAAGETRQLVFRLGAGSTPAEARALVQRWRGLHAAEEGLAAVHRLWFRSLGTIQVETPDCSLNLLVNGWLPYQTLACRLWARNAFYQSSGAFGFRDQLQDVMALVHAEPGLVRAHLLRCASRQFAEGDVQHWWHPPSGRGVRTRCSDDFLWLPLAVCRYVRVTDDAAVLDESVAFLKGRNLRDHEDAYYDLPGRSDAAGTLYEHCVRAIEHGLRFGAHGLPLMGTGDWNDGMNLVGAAGKGESVWLGFFLCTVLEQFGAIATRFGDGAFAQRCGVEEGRLRHAIEDQAWDGNWYRRGWFDDGSPLGTSANHECRIDSIAQSWSVLCGATDAARARSAMEAVDQHLVHRQSSLVLLLDPPFDHSNPSPGYIQGYVPGVRENGGQYTHAAVWAAMAFAKLGDEKRAWELFTMLDPIRRADSPHAMATYQTEPYVMASDVYSRPPYVGRGGWTWYTGAAGWMFQFIVESLLGLHVEGNTLRIEPCMPAAWPSFKLSYRYRTTLYCIEVMHSDVADDSPMLMMDGLSVAGRSVSLVDDGHDHAVVVRILRPG